MGPAKPSGRFQDHPGGGCCESDTGCGPGWASASAPSPAGSPPACLGVWGRLLLPSKGRTHHCVEFGRASWAVLGHSSSPSPWDLLGEGTSPASSLLARPPTGNCAPECAHTCACTHRGTKAFPHLAYGLLALALGGGEEEREELLGNQPGVAMAFPKAAGPISVECRLLSVIAGGGSEAAPRSRSAGGCRPRRRRAAYLMNIHCADCGKAN